MIRVVFLIAFMVVGGEAIHTALPASPQHERNFSNVMSPAKQAHTPQIKTHKPA